MSTCTYFSKTELIFTLTSLVLRTILTVVEDVRFSIHDCTLYTPTGNDEIRGGSSVRQMFAVF